MKTLIITAHPSTIGHTHIIANTYKLEKESIKIANSELDNKTSNEVRMHNLYTSTSQLPFFNFENRRELPRPEALEFFQNEIMWAEEIVFVHPIWWGGTPAILKNWLDTVLETRFAYKYVEGKRVGMLTGKCVKVFATSGGPSYLYNFFLAPFYLTWRVAINEFCGLYQKEILVCGDMSSPNAEEGFVKFLEKIKQSARN